MLKTPIKQKCLTLLLLPKDRQLPRVPGAVLVIAWSCINYVFLLWKQAYLTLTACRQDVCLPTWRWDVRLITHWQEVHQNVCLPLIVQRQKVHWLVIFAFKLLTNVIWYFILRASWVHTCTVSIQCQYLNKASSLIKICELSDWWIFERPQTHNNMTSTSERLIKTLTSVLVFYFVEHYFLTFRKSQCCRSYFIRCY